MKTKTNIALEGTCNGDVVGGLYREPRKTFRRFCLERGVSWEAFTNEAKFFGFSIIGTGNLTEKPQRARKKPMPSVY
jgi:hypothetical protein